MIENEKSCMWRVVCDKVVWERWCVAKKDGACDSCVWKRGCDQVVCARWAKKAQPTVVRPTRPSPTLLHVANERHHCKMQLALQQSPHASVTRECHKRCLVPNVTKNLNMTIEIKRRTLHQPMPRPELAIGGSGPGAAHRSRNVVQVQAPAGARDMRFGSRRSTQRPELALWG